MNSTNFYKTKLCNRKRKEFLYEYSALFSNAFFNDPLYVNAISSENERRKILPALFKSTIYYGLLFGKTHIIRSKGIAVWLSPGEQSITMKRAFQAGMFKAPFEVGIPALFKLAHFSSISEKMHKIFAPDPHWYLFLLAVDPIRQGLGFGGKLIKPVLDLADQQDLPCYLDTCNPEAVIFYQKHGFRVVSEERTSISDFSFWGLRRDAIT